MMRSLFSASTGMKGQELNIDVISNNLANVSTTGFKKNRVDFQDLLYQTLKEPGAPVANGATYPVGIQLGHGVKAVANQKIFTQGEFQQTEHPLDVVIEGRGFFQVQLPNGDIGYTRDGAWKLNETGLIVNSEGYRILPEMTVPPNASGINITTSGAVAVRLPNQNELQVIGQIEIADFVNQAGLKSIGRNIYIPTGSSGDPIPGVPGTQQLGEIAQGFIEMSNVKVVEEMVNMIVAQRAYEANSKTIQTSDTMLQIANNLRR
ncbi:MAG: flagellar basal-body rod protein FlgG [Candidatus Riflebacteria bacterium]|nr:flagellar basal-body rod protein FlgG [Candidatus Riflebacteria bacterium]